MIWSFSVGFFDNAKFKIFWLVTINFDQIWSFSIDSWSSRLFLIINTRMTTQVLQTMWKSVALADHFLFWYNDKLIPPYSQAVGNECFAGKSQSENFG